MIIVPRLADLYGRKILLVLGNCSMLPLIMWTLNARTLIELYYIFFLVGFCFASNYSVALVYFQEMVMKAYRLPFVTMLGLF